MLAIYKKEKEVSGDSMDDSPRYEVVVGKRSRGKVMEILKKSNLILWFHNGVLQVLTPPWYLPKITVKQIIKN